MGQFNPWLPGAERIWPPRRGKLAHAVPPDGRGASGPATRHLLELLQFAAVRDAPRLG
jgi:hypothetical protein